MTTDTVPPPQNLHCAVCNKDIYTRYTPPDVVSYVEVKVKDQDDCSAKQWEYLKEQFAPYPPTHKYYICCGCYLKAMGVPEPK